jgi:hypothetical protein
MRLGEKYPRSGDSSGNGGTVVSETSEGDLAIPKVLTDILWLANRLRSMIIAFEASGARTSPAQVNALCCDARRALHGLSSAGDSGGTMPASRKKGISPDVARVCRVDGEHAGDGGVSASDARHCRELQVARRGVCGEYDMARRDDEARARDHR